MFCSARIVVPRSGATLMCAVCRVLCVVCRVSRSCCVVLCCVVFVLCCVVFVSFVCRVIKLTWASRECEVPRTTEKEWEASRRPLPPEFDEVDLWTCMDCDPEVPPHACGGACARAV
jgi:hypothetical protein